MGLVEGHWSEGVSIWIGINVKMKFSNRVRLVIRFPVRMGFKVRFRSL